MSNFASKYAQHWLLNPEIIYLNHGSLGACPLPVLQKQQELRELMETEPVQFLDGTYYDLLAESQAALGAFIGADPADLAYVPNATTGVNAVLNSLTFSPGDEILITDHIYGACKNTVRHIAGRQEAKVVVAHIPFPLQNPDEAIEALLSVTTSRTRLALIDHITSPTALVLPIAHIVAELDRRGVDTLVDGAHAPGQVELDMEALGAAYYTGNCHKWLCTPKGSAFLYVRRDKQRGLHPVTISHGYNAEVPHLSRFQLEFEWTGTADPTACLSVREALNFLGSLMPGGWPALRRHNHELALVGRDILCAALNIEPPCPTSMLGAMASLPLPDGDAHSGTEHRRTDALQLALFENFRIEVPVMAWPAAPQRVIRISAQAYNAPEQYELLAEALKKLL